MEKNINVYDIVISCPSDVIEEINAIETAIKKINASSVEQHKIIFRLKTWYTDVESNYGEEPQEHINKQLIDKCDILIGIFKTRLGTPTGKDVSGTIEEIERFNSDGKKIFLYFAKNAQIDIDTFDIEQLTNLKKFKEECKNNSLYKTFNDIEKLQEICYNDFLIYINEIYRGPVIDIKEREKEERFDTNNNTTIKGDVINTNHDADSNEIENGIWDSIVEIIEDCKKAQNDLEEMTNDTIKMSEDTDLFTKKISNLQKQPKLNPIIIKNEYKKFAEQFDQYSQTFIKNYNNDVWNRIIKNTKIILKLKVNTIEDKVAKDNFIEVYENMLLNVCKVKNILNNNIPIFENSKGVQKDLNIAIDKYIRNSKKYIDSLNRFINDSKNMLSNYKIER